MKVFSVTAQGDTIYFKALSMEDAKAQYDIVIGPMPGIHCSWKELKELPEGEEFFI